MRNRSRISGPLLDRIDLAIDVPALPPGEIAVAGDAPPMEPSSRVRERVAAARARQHARQGVCNARLAVADLQRHGMPNDDARTLAARAMERFGLSARAYHRILKVARTIADLAGADTVGPTHVAESIALRRVHAAGASPHETAAPGRQGNAA